MLLDAVSLYFPQEGGVPRTVFTDLTIAIPNGAITAVMGPSGCGKTSLLRLVAGLQEPTKGAVRRDAGDGEISFVFQENRLFPQLTALENVNLVLSDSRATLPQAQKWLAAVELAETAEQYPDELSGGMQRRVALARGLCRESGLLLLDEPFSGLDDALHLRMLRLVGNARHGKTTLLATHDTDDLAVCDYLLIFSDTPGNPPALSRL